MSSCRDINVWNDLTRVQTKIGVMARKAFNRKDLELVTRDKVQK